MGLVEDLRLLKGLLALRGLFMRLVGAVREQKMGKYDVRIGAGKFVVGVLHGLIGALVPVVVPIAIGFFSDANAVRAAADAAGTPTKFAVALTAFTVGTTKFAVNYFKNR